MTKEMEHKRVVRRLKCYGAMSADTSEEDLFTVAMIVRKWSVQIASTGTNAKIVPMVG